MADDNALAPTTEQSNPQPQALSLLANDMYGKNYHGPLAEVPPVTDENEAEPASTEQTPAEDDTPPEAEAVEETTEPEGETEPEDTDTEKAEEEPVSSLAELIEAQEWDPEWVDSLKVPVKVDGTPAEATIADLVKSYQMGEAADKRLEDAKTKARALTEEAGQLKQAVETQLSVAGKLIASLESGLDDEASDIAKLREDDPAEYSARKEDLRDRRQALEKLKRDAVADFEKAREGEQTQQTERQNEFLQQQHTMLLERLPEWRDADKAKAEKSELVSYLLNQGFEQQDVMQAADHRLILLARKAMLFDRSQTKTNVAKKKVAKVPKVMKPGAPKPQEQVNREQVDQARQRLRKSGTMDDAMALLRAKRGTQ